VMENKMNVDALANVVAAHLVPGKKTFLTNKTLYELFDKNNVISNDRKAMYVRRILPFTGKMIIPELDLSQRGIRREKSTMTFTKIQSEEDFINYKFTEKNFRKLEQVTIDEVVNNAKKIGYDGYEGKVAIMKILTILDTILIVTKDYEIYHTIERPRLMAYTRESKSVVNMFLKNLVDIGLLSYKGRFEDRKCLFCVHKTRNSANESVINVDFERLQGDYSTQKDLTSDQGNVTILEVSKKETDALEGNVKKFLKEDGSSTRECEFYDTQADEGLEGKSLESLLGGILNYDRRQQAHFHKEKLELLKQIDQLKEKIAQQGKELSNVRENVSQQKKQISEQNEKLEAMKIVEGQIKKLSDENEKLKRDQQVFAENIKDYKAFKKTVKGRVEAVMDRFNSQVYSILMDNVTPSNQGRAMRKMSEVTVDTTHSILNTMTMKA